MVGNCTKNFNLIVLLKEKLMLAHTMQFTTRGLVLTVLLMTFNACNFSQSIEKDLITGLTTRGDGLSCEEVYLSDGENIIKRNNFIYGETFYVNFDGVEGFEKEDKNAFPEMEIIVTNDRGDTALYIHDMYEGYKDGIDISPLHLYSELTVADPIHTGENYTLNVNISDRKGDGSFRANMDFDVVHNDKISVKSDQISFGEIYLFSQQKGHVITNGKAGYNENLYLIFEGLQGFTEEEGKVHLGLSMVVKDAEGNLILDEPDLFGDSMLDTEEAHYQIAPSFILTGTQVANPVSCTIRIWDKRSSAWISATTEIVIE